MSRGIIFLLYRVTTWQLYNMSYSMSRKDGNAVPSVVRDIFSVSLNLNCSRSFKIQWILVGSEVIVIMTPISINVSVVTAAFFLRRFFFDHLIHTLNYKKNEIKWIQGICLKRCLCNHPSRSLAITRRMNNSYQ